MRTSQPGPPGHANAAAWVRWLLPAAVAAGFVALLVLPRGATPGTPLTYTRFVADVGAGTVRAVTIGPAGQVTGTLARGQPFTTTIPVALGGNGLAAVAAIGGGVTAAAATTSHASSRPAASQHAAATVRTMQATVGGKTETVLVNSQGLPLYYYLNDTAAKSVVTGGLAALWPPLTSASPAATGLTGRLAAVMDVHGDQVAYNGHLLYTFADDQAGQVTGQGVQGFFVATPGLTPLAGSSTAGSQTAGSQTAGSSTTAGTAPAAPSGNPYGY